jgi:hypothetical protein
MSVAGPALQVLDLETPGGASAQAKEKDEEGVKVLIKLEALDANGMPCKGLNHASPANFP